MLTKGYSDEGRAVLKSMSALRGLAQEILDMDEYERLSTLKHVVKLEVDEPGKGKNRFWIKVTNHLLTRPELLPSIISFAEREMSSAANPQYMNAN